MKEPTDEKTAERALEIIKIIFDHCNEGKTVIFEPDSFKDSLTVLFKGGNIFQSFDSRPNLTHFHVNSVGLSCNNLIKQLRSGFKIQVEYDHG